MFFFDLLFAKLLLKLTKDNYGNPVGVMHIEKLPREGVTHRILHSPSFYIDNYMYDRIYSVPNRE